MADITKADWKLFRERIGGWQEAQMDGRKGSKMPIKIIL